MNDTISRRVAIDKFEPWLNVQGYSEGERNMLKAVLYDLKFLPSAQQWTPCSEGLPEYDQEVLVTRHFVSDNQLKKNAITESFYVEVASYMGDEWTSYSDEYKIKRHLHKVIAWMPLPEPWKGEQP